MAFGTMTSRILGQVRETLLAAYFDKGVTDAWAAAFRIPNVFRRLLAEGSLSVSFIPVFIEASLNDQEKAQNLVNSTYTFLLLLLGSLTCLGVLYPEVMLRYLLDSAYIANFEKFWLTVRLAKIMFGFVFFISTYAFMMGILNALGQFALPAIAPTFWNICMIISTLVPQNWFSHSGDQLAIGVIAGGLAQALILVPAFIQTGYFPKISFNFKNSDFLRVLKNMGPGLIGIGLLQFTTIVNLKFASSLPEGTISYINYVDRLIELPLSLVSVSLGTALLPVLTEFLAKNKKESFLVTIQDYLELNLLLTFASAVGLFVLAKPIIQLIFGHGHFNTSENIESTTRILKNYCWIMIFTSGVRVLTPAYYSVKNTWFPAVTSGLSLILHLILAPILLRQYHVQGLMISTIFSASLNFFLLIIFFSKFVLPGFKFFNFFKNFIKILVLSISVGMAAQCYFLFNLNSIFSNNQIGLVAGVMLSILFSLIVFVLTGYLLRIEILSHFLKKLIKRIK